MTRYTKLGFPKYCSATKFEGVPLMPKKSELSSSSDHVSMRNASNLTLATISNAKIKKKSQIKKKLSMEKGQTILKTDHSMEDMKNKHPQSLKPSTSINSSSSSSSISKNQSKLIPTSQSCRYCGSHLHSSKKCKPNLNQETLTSAGILLPGVSADDDEMHSILKKIETDRALKMKSKKKRPVKHSV